jgi:hypothetical protein
MLDRRLDARCGALLLAAALIACGPDRQVRPSGPTRGSAKVDAIAPAPLAEWSFRYSSASNLAVEPEKWGGARATS